VIRDDGKTYTRRVQLLAATDEAADDNDGLLYYSFHAGLRAISSEANLYGESRQFLRHSKNPSRRRYCAWHPITQESAGSRSGIPSPTKRHCCPIKLSLSMLLRMSNAVPDSRKVLEAREGRGNDKLISASLEHTGRIANNICWIVPKSIVHSSQYNCLCIGHSRTVSHSCRKRLLPSGMVVSTHQSQQCTLQKNLPSKKNTQKCQLIRKLEIGDRYRT
jgi:hypothetical protein